MTTSEEHALPQPGGEGKALNHSADEGTTHFAPPSSFVAERFDDVDPVWEQVDNALAERLSAELGDETLVRWFDDMCLLRRFEEEAGRAYRKQLIKGFCLSEVRTLPVRFIL